MGLAGSPKQSSGHRWLCGYTSGPRKHSWQQRFSSEDAAAADGQLPFACAATRGGSGKGSVDLPFWHCATTIVLHLKRGWRGSTDFLNSQPGHNWNRNNQTLLSCFLTDFTIRLQQERAILVFPYSRSVIIFSA